MAKVLFKDLSVPLKVVAIYVWIVLGILGLGLLVIIGTILASI